MNAWEKYKQDREKRKQEETEKFSGSSAWETYKAGRKAEAEQPASAPVRKTMLAAEKDGFQRENLYEDSVGETSPSYEELASMTLQERLARSQLGQQEAAKNMLKDAGYVGERFGLGVATGLEGLADAAILAKAQGLLDSPTEKTGKAIADILGIRKKTTEELMTENLAKQALANQATAPWQASIEDRYDPNRVTETVGEISQTIGNMAPSIVGNILLPGIGIPVMGVAAGGQGAQQAYQETADLGKATLYGMATGGLEAGTELLFGGLAGLGKGVADTAVGKVVKKAASALGDSKAGKVISGFANSPVVKAVADSLGEGVEEVIATYLDPFLQRVIYNPNAQNATAEELIQSGLMGMLVGGVFQVGNAALGGLMGEGYVPPKQVEPEINEMDAAPVQTEQDSNAVDTHPEQTHLSNKQVERMIRDEATMREMGIDTNGKTMSQLRAEVRAKLAAQEQGAETSSEESRVQTSAQEVAHTANPAASQAETRSRMNMGEVATAVLGENGAKAFRSTYNSDMASRVDAESAATGFNTVYKAALDGRTMTAEEQTQTASLPSELKLAAESSARLDRQRASQAKYFGGNAMLLKDDNFKKMHLSSKTVRTLDAVAKVAGVQVRFVEQVKEGRANAAYGSGVIEIAMDSNDPVMTAFTHEIVHRIRETSPQSYAAMAEFVQKYLSENTGKALADRYKKTYNTTDVSFYTEEMVADAFGTILQDSKAMEQFVKDDRSTAQKVLDAVRDLINAVKRALNHQNVELNRDQKIAFMALQNKLTEMESAMVKALESVPQSAEKNTATEGGEVRHNLKGKQFQEDKYFARQMDQWSGLSDGIRVKVGVVQDGSALNRVGLPVSGMYFDVGKIRKSMGDHADHLTPTKLKEIPDLLNDPIVITEYKGPKGDIKNTVNVYGNMFVGNTPVVVGIVMKLDRSGSGLITNVRTVHERGNFAKQITDESVLYLNEDKKKTLDWFQVCGNLNVPLEGTKFGVIRSITYDGSDVNTAADSQFDGGKASLKSQDGDFSEAAKAAIKDAQLAGMMNQGRKDAEKLRRAKETTAEVRRKRDDTIRKLKEHQRDQRQKASESRNASAIRGKIQRHVADLSRTLRNPTDKKHVPEALRGPVAKLLESINLESKDGAPTKRTQAFNELKKVYAEISENLVIDPDLLGGEGTTGLLDDVIAMADKRIADMNTEELDTIWKTVRAIEASIRTANKAFSAGRFQTIQEAADALRSDNLFKRGKTELNYIDKLQKLTGVDMLTPEAYFHRLGKAGDAIFRMMRNAQDKHIRLMKQVADFTGENLSDVDVRTLEKEMHTVRLGGQDVELSTAQLMELYALMRRQQAMEHLVEGGILPDVVSKRGLKKTAKAEPIHGVTAEELMEAVGVLTEEQVQIAELLQEYASTTLSDFGNEASMEVYGYRKFTEPHYWPIRSNRQEVRSDIQKDTQVTSVANRGFTKNVKPHANNSVMVGSIFDTFAAHSSDMATYAAWLGTSEDVNRIRNFVFRAVDEDGKTKTVGTVKGILDRVHGTNKGQQYLQKLLADIANGVKGVDVSASMTGGLLGNYKAASVGGNLRVVIQQPTAILRAFDLIDPKYFVSGSNPVRGFEKAKQYAPIAVWKDWGYFDIHTGRQMKDVLFNSESALDKTREASMWLAGKMDSVSWGMLWNAIEAETKDKTDLNPGTEAFYQKVAERFNEVIDRTQVVDGILQRSQIMRDPGDLKKMVTAFMGEPTKQYNMLLSAVYDARNGIPGGKRALVRTGVSLATAAVMNAAVQSIIDAFRDDDREQDYWEKWLEAFLGVGSEDKGAMKLLNSNVGSAFNPLGYLPYVKDAWSMVQGYDVSRMDMDSIDKTVSAAGNLIKALRGEGKSTIGGAVITMLAEMAKLAGVPVANLKREITSFALTAAMESDNHLMEYRIRRVLYKVPENTTMYYDILYSAMQNDPEAYEIIYADMVRSGLGEDKIKNGMEKRMKSAQGVESVADLEQRWMSPEQKGAYDTYLRRMEKSSVWGKAKADQRSAAEELLYEYVTGSADKMAEKLEDGIRYGVDETEYMLYKLALSMTDKPSENGNYGSYTNDEVKAAIDMLGLGKKESAWLWEAQGRSEKSNPYK